MAEIAGEAERTGARRGGWDARTRERFLTALRGLGEVKRAADAAGRSTQSAYALRHRDAGFAAAWDSAVAEVRAVRERQRAAAALAGGPERGLLKLRARADGWTADRQRRFLRTLGRTGCVRDACRAAGLSSNSAYRARKVSPAFAEAWNRAQTRGMRTIEQAAFERAVHGWDEVVTRGGEEVSTRRRFSDSLLRVMLQRGDLKQERQGLSQAELEVVAQEAAKAAGGWFQHAREEAEIREALTRKLEEMRTRLIGDRDLSLAEYFALNLPLE